MDPPPKKSSKNQDENDTREVRYIWTGQATGWGAIAAHMREYDEEKVKAVKDDIDTLLVFAGLFSAVLSALVVESYQKLLPDVTSMMLATHVQSLAVLQQLSLQMANTSYHPTVAIASTNAIPFQPSTAAIRINVLWFASLMFSLITASFGILVKQWLREYMAVDSSSPQARLRLRNYRYLALQQWQVFEIAAALPLLQQLALALFFVGLCYFTANVHDSIGNTTLPLAVGWAFCFLLVTILPVLFPRCPYKTTLLKTIFKSSHLLVIRAVDRLTYYPTSGIHLCCLAFNREMAQQFFNWSNERAWRPDRHLSCNNEKEIIKQDEADLKILGDADAFQSNDELLGTTVLESLKQVHWLGLQDIVPFLFRLLEHRLPEASHLSLERPRLLSLNALSQSAYLGMMDILSHYLSAEFRGEVHDELSESTAAYSAIFLFFSEGRHPLPSSGVRALFDHGKDMLRLLVHHLPTSVSQHSASSLLQVMMDKAGNRAWASDPQTTDSHPFHSHVAMLAFLLDECLCSKDPTSSLYFILRNTTDNSYTKFLMRSIVDSACWQPPRSSNIMEAIDLWEEEIPIRRNSATLLHAIANTCILNIRSVESSQLGRILCVAHNHKRIPLEGLLRQLTQDCYQTADPSSALSCLVRAMEYAAEHLNWTLVSARRQLEIVLETIPENQDVNRDSGTIDPADHGRDDISTFPWKDLEENTRAAILTFLTRLVMRTLQAASPSHSPQHANGSSKSLSTNDTLLEADKSSALAIMDVFFATIWQITHPWPVTLTEPDKSMLPVHMSFYSIMRIALCNQYGTIAIIRALGRIHCSAVIGIVSRFRVERQLMFRRSEEVGQMLKNLVHVVTNTHVQFVKDTGPGGDSRDSQHEHGLIHALRVMCFCVHLTNLSKSFQTDHADMYKTLLQATVQLVYRSSVVLHPDYIRLLSRANRCSGEDSEEDAEKLEDRTFVAAADTDDKHRGLDRAVHHFTPDDTLIINQLSEACLKHIQANDMEDKFIFVRSLFDDSLVEILGAIYILSYHVPTGNTTKEDFYRLSQLNMVERMLRAGYTFTYARDGTALGTGDPNPGHSQETDLDPQLLSSTIDEVPLEEGNTDSVSQAEERDNTQSTISAYPEPSSLTADSEDVRTTYAEEAKHLALDADVTSAILASEEVVVDDEDH